MIREQTMALGSLVKTHAFKGEFSLAASVNLDELQIKTELVFLETGGQLVPFFVESFLITGTQSAILKLEDINSPEQAREWIHKKVFIPLKNVKKQGRKSRSEADLSGYRVLDENLGPIGKVVGLLENTANPLLEVDMNGKQILIPFQEGIILEVDHKKQLIRTSTPEGLLDL